MVGCLSFGTRSVYRRAGEESSGRHSYNYACWPQYMTSVTGWSWAVLDILQRERWGASTRYNGMTLVKKEGWRRFFLNALAMDGNSSYGALVLGGGRRYCLRLGL